jgi:cytochrome P450
MLRDHEPAPGQLERMSQVLQQGEEYLKGLIQERRRRPGDDLLSALITAEENGQALGENELVIICTMLLFAGHETTHEPDGQRHAGALPKPRPTGPAPAAAGIDRTCREELLRYDSPVQVVYRSTTVPLTLHGVTIPAGQNIMLVLGAANHDAAKFPSPPVENAPGRTAAT